MLLEDEVGLVSTLDDIEVVVSSDICGLVVVAELVVEVCELVVVVEQSIDVILEDNVNFYSRSQT